MPDRTLSLPEKFPWPEMVADLSPGDTMHRETDSRYLDVGQSALACIEAALEGRVPRHILDLPCGHGRVLRFLRARFPHVPIVACDLDRAGVDFCARHFVAEPVYATANVRGLRFGRAFDLIWVGSLVTHLDEIETRAFLGRMRAHLTRDGVLAVTSHGPSIAPRLKEWGYGLAPEAVADLLDQYGARGFGHRPYGPTDGYGISLTDAAWWRGVAADLHLRIARYDEQAWDDHQDLVVLHSARPGDARTDGAPATTAEPAVRQATAAYDPVLRQFDAAYYLRANPDVADAVADGTFASAFEHFWQRGRFEGRQPRAP